MPETARTSSQSRPSVSNGNGQEKPVASGAKAPDSQCAKKRAGFLFYAAEAIDAQISIWKSQFALGLIRMAASIVAGAMLSALAVYGFVLLDRAMDIAITLNSAAWVSPLVRGLVYFAVPATILTPFVKSAFGQHQKGSNGENKDCGANKHAV